MREIVWYISREGWTIDGGTKAISTETGGIEGAGFGCDGSGPKFIDGGTVL